MYRLKPDSPEFIALSAFASGIGVDVVLTQARKFAFLPATDTQAAKMFVPVTSSPAQQGDMAARMARCFIFKIRDVA